jgi:hypothetical protein
MIDPADGSTCTQSMSGSLCNDNDRACGPSPPNAPANLACFSGTGIYSASGDKRTTNVAYRVEVEDHGEPAGASPDATTDEYRIWIYIPQGTETVKGLATAICCRNAPSGNTNRAGDTFAAGRTANVFDGGNLIHGNIQIHPQIGICPLSDTTCPPSIP